MPMFCLFGHYMVTVMIDYRDNLKPPNFDTPSRKLTIEEIDKYWGQWKNVFSPDKDKFWDGILFGLNDYLAILQGKLY